MVERGFTLIELMVVTVVVGILTAIAVPQFGAYRQRAFDTQALAELRSVALAEEAYYVEQERYLSCQDQHCAVLPGIGRITSTNQISITAQDEYFEGQSNSRKGSGRVFRWDSSRGGLQE